MIAPHWAHHLSHSLVDALIDHINWAERAKRNLFGSTMTDTIGEDMRSWLIEQGSRPSPSIEQVSDHRIVEEGLPIVHDFFFGLNTDRSGSAETVACHGGIRSYSPPLLLWLCAVTGTG